MKSRRSELDNMDKQMKQAILGHLLERMLRNEKTPQGREVRAFDIYLEKDGFSLKRKDVTKGICIKHMGYDDCKCGKC